MTDLTKAKSFVSKLDIVQMAPDELAHHGVMGQKWGKRKDDSVAREARIARGKKNTRQKLAVGTLGASVAIPAAVKAAQARKAAAAARQSSDHKTSRELAKKPTSNLSNQDIDKIVQRLQKEQKLKQLNPSNVARGKKIALGVVAAAGTAATVYNLVDSKAGKAAIARGSKVVAAILQKAA